MTSGQGAAHTDLCSPSHVQQQIQHQVQDQVHHQGTATRARLLERIWNLTTTSASSLASDFHASVLGSPRTSLAPSDHLDCAPSAASDSRSDVPSDKGHDDTTPLASTSASVCGEEGSVGQGDSPAVLVPRWNVVDDDWGEPRLIELRRGGKPKKKPTSKEDTSDEAYIKRHRKHEAAELRNKRYEREPLIYADRQPEAVWKDYKHYHKPDALAKMWTLLPSIAGLDQIHFVDDLLPVAFGMMVPPVTKCAFTLPTEYRTGSGKGERSPGKKRPERGRRKTGGGLSCSIGANMSDGKYVSDRSTGDSWRPAAAAESRGERARRRRGSEEGDKGKGSLKRTHVEDSDQTKEKAWSLIQPARKTAKHHAGSTPAPPPITNDKGLAGSV